MTQGIDTYLGALAGAAGFFLTSGCIVAEPPPYEPPPQTPPLLQLHLAIPQIGVPLPVDLVTDIAPDENTFVEFSVPVRSEDQGDPLWYAFHLNYQITNVQANLQLKSRLPPSTFDDTTRKISGTWRVSEPRTAGCHQVTLVVAHENNWNYEQDRPKPFGDPNDVATATWWINVDPAPGERFTLKNCPSGQLVER